jgi:hypothetical protein
LPGPLAGVSLHRVSTDALNRAPSAEFSEVTGITQTARNFAASLGLAVLGAILISESKTKVSAALTHAGVPRAVAHRIASSFSAGSAPPGPSSGRSSSLVHDVQLAFAHSTQPVFYAMAGVLAASFLVTLDLAPAWAGRSA